MRRDGAKSPLILIPPSPPSPTTTGADDGAKYDVRDSDSPLTIACGIKKAMGVDIDKSCKENFKKTPREMTMDDVINFVADTLEKTANDEDLVLKKNLVIMIVNDYLIDPDCVFKNAAAQKKEADEKNKAAEESKKQKVIEKLIDPLNDELKQYPLTLRLNGFKTIVERVENSLRENKAISCDTAQIVDCDTAQIVDCDTAQIVDYAAARVVDIVVESYLTNPNCAYTKAAKEFKKQAKEELDNGRSDKFSSVAQFNLSNNSDKAASTHHITNSVFSAHSEQKEQNSGQEGGLDELMFTMDGDGLDEICIHP